MQGRCHKIPPSSSASDNRQARLTLDDTEHRFFHKLVRKQRIPLTSSSQTCSLVKQQPKQTPAPSLTNKLNIQPNKEQLDFDGSFVLQSHPNSSVSRLYSLRNSDIGFSLFEGDSAGNLHLGDLITKFDQLVYEYRSGHSKGTLPSGHKTIKSTTSVSAVTKLSEVSLGKEEKLDQMIKLGKLILERASKHEGFRGRVIPQLVQTLEFLKSEKQKLYLRATKSNSSQVTPQSTHRKCSTSSIQESVALTQRSLGAHELDGLLRRLSAPGHSCTKQGCTGCREGQNTERSNQNSSRTPSPDTSRLLTQISADRFFADTLRNNLDQKIPKPSIVKMKRNSSKEPKLLAPRPAKPENTLVQNAVSQDKIEVSDPKIDIDLPKYSEPEPPVKPVVVTTLHTCSSGESTSLLTQVRSRRESQVTTHSAQNEPIPDPEVRMVAKMLARIGNMQNIAQGIASTRLNMRKSLLEIDASKLQMMIESVQKGFGEVKQAISQSNEVAMKEQAKSTALKELSSEVSSEISRVGITNHKATPDAAGSSSQ